MEAENKICGKKDGHFDGGAFGCGLALGLVVWFFTIVVFEEAKSRAVAEAKQETLDMRFKKVNYRIDVPGGYHTFECNEELY